MYAEECIRYYANNLDFVILRFPNVYGENNNKGVIFNFLEDIENKHEITIYGDGTQSRNFLHVIDACQAIEKSIFYEQSEIFNISNPNKISINDIEKILAKKYEFSVNYREANNNLKDLLLNIDKAKRKLNFEPRICELVI
jgi:UDP-glucose 4-epimerase